MPPEQPQQINDTPKESNQQGGSDSGLMFPTKETLEFFGFTSGHQNNFGVPIEEDERVLRMLKDQLIKAEEDRIATRDYLVSSTTDTNSYRTRVSPTLPIINKFDATTERLMNSSDDGKLNYTI